MAHRLCLAWQGGLSAGEGPAHRMFEALWTAVPRIFQMDSRAPPDLPRPAEAAGRLHIFRLPQSASRQRGNTVSHLLRMVEAQLATFIDFCPRAHRDNGVETTSVTRSP